MASDFRGESRRRSEQDRFDARWRSYWVLAQMTPLLPPSKLLPRVRTKRRCGASRTVFASFLIPRHRKNCRLCFERTAHTWS